MPWTKLVEICIHASTQAGDVVLDPFMGAGTVVLESIRLGREWLGCEINPEYIAIANRRISEVQASLFA